MTHDVAALQRLGLQPGEPARFRKTDGGRWFAAKFSVVASDGSITVFDANGAARSLWPDRVEVRRLGSRRRLVWISVADLLLSSEQLRLW